MNRILLAAFTLPFLLFACNESPSSSQANAMQVENNQQRLQIAQPAPRVDVSAERTNLIARLQRLNTENMSGYVYLISQGTIVASYPVKGKVTSLNAYLMAQDRVENWGSVGVASIEQPDYDGAYGKNADGVFFFTADTNTYVEWQGDYLYTDAPLNLNGQPKLIREVK